MNSRRPSPVTATNFREPFAWMRAGSTQVTGSPADRSAAAIPSGPIRRSGTPNATSTPAPTVTPAANASISSAGRTVPVISRAPAAAPNVIHAVRRQGRLSHGAAATVTAAAAASRAGPGNAALASNEPCPPAAVTACGCWSPARYKMPASMAPAAAAPAVRPPSRRNRRCHRAAATTPAAATAKATCSTAVSSRPAGSVPSQVTAGAPGPSSRPCATTTAASVPASTRPLMIRRMTSPG